MPMGNLGEHFDEGEVGEEKDVYYPTINVKSNQIAELEDFAVKDDIVLEVKGTIKSVTARDKGEGMDVDVVIELHNGKIINRKAIRKEAEEHGLSIADMKEVKDGEKKK